MLMNINSVSTSRFIDLVAAGLLFSMPNAEEAQKLYLGDKDFILTAALGVMTAVKLGELATWKGGRDDVKEFGQMMVKDHADIIDDLKVLAAQKRMILPVSLDAKHQKLMDQMTALTGSQFDDSY